LILLAGCLLSMSAFALVVVHQHYDRALTRVVDVIAAKIENRAQLQRAIYELDGQILEAMLEQLLSVPEVTGASIFSASGDPLAETGSLGGAGVSLRSLRGDVSLLDKTLTRRGADGVEPGGSFWSALLTGEPLDLTIPVITSVNPTESGLTASDFLVSMLDQNSGSRTIMGYGHAVIDPGSILSDAGAEVWPMLGLLVVVALLFSWLVNRHLGAVRRSLAELDRLAEEVGAGRPVESLSVPNSPETRKLAEAVKMLIGQIKESRYDAEAGRKMLGWKEDESASRLSERDDKLSRAAEEIVETKEALRKLTFYDGLTSLPNRALFREHLQLLLNSSERGGKPLALLSMNLNNFARVNDSFGHSVGDLVLTEVANRLKQCLRRNDVVSSDTTQHLGADVSRVGGDEFALVLNQIDKAESASKVAQRIIEQVTAPISVADHEIVVAPSIGIAIAPRDALDVEGLTRAASLAMNNAPQDPNGSLLFYTQDMARDEEDQFRLEAELRRAVERGQLSLRYQPQVDTADGSIACAEALMRWTHPEFGEVPPSRFIPLAKKAGIMQVLGQWALQEACRQLAELRSGGLELARMAINVTPEEIGSGLVDRVRETLEETGLSPDSLELGLSEIVFTETAGEVSRTLRELSELGVHLSLDNFGIGPTSLSHLGILPIDELKVDYQIVHKCDRNVRNASLVKAVIAVAESLQLRIVASGVETPGEYNFLVASGARMLQGFLFSEPVDADELRRQLEIPWPYMSRIQTFKLAQAREAV
jgi:diguanylate cyclase (GGDEF)-like protein